MKKDPRKEREGKQKRNEAFLQNIVAELNKNRKGWSLEGRKIKDDMFQCFVNVGGGYVEIKPIFPYDLDKRKELTNWMIPFVQETAKNEKKDILIFVTDQPQQESEKYENDMFSTGPKSEHVKQIFQSIPIQRSPFGVHYFINEYANIGFNLYIEHGYFSIFYQPRNGFNFNIRTIENAKFFFETENKWNETKNKFFKYLLTYLNEDPNAYYCKKTYTLHYKGEEKRIEFRPNIVKKEGEKSTVEWVLKIEKKYKTFRTAKEALQSAKQMMDEWKNTNSGKTQKLTEKILNEAFTNFRYVYGRTDFPPEHYYTFEIDQMSNQENWDVYLQKKTLQNETFSIRKELYTDFKKTDEEIVLWRWHIFETEEYVFAHFGEKNENGTQKVTVYTHEEFKQELQKKIKARKLKNLFENKK